MSLCDYSSPQYPCPEPNPDISGLGVFVSSLAIGFAAAISSIWQAILRDKIDSRSSHFMRENQLDRDDPAVRRYMDENPVLRRYAFWYDVLERIIISLADQQIVTGYALLVTAYSRLPFPLSHRGRLQPAQFALVVYLSCVSGFTHLACMVTLETYLDKHPTLASIRFILMIIFGVGLILSVGFLGASGRDNNVNIFTFGSLGLFFLVQYLLALTNILPSWRRWAVKRFGRITFFKDVFSTSWAYMCMAWGFLVYVFYLAIRQKFSVCLEGDFCPGLSSVAEVWSFGQVLPLFMLLLPAFSILEVYLELKDKEKTVTHTSSAAAGPGSSVAGLASQTQVPQTTNDGGSSPASSGSGTSDQSHTDLQSAPSDIEFHSLVSLALETQEDESGSTVNNSHKIGQAQTASTCPPTASTTSGRQSDAENFGPPPRRRTAGQMV